MFRALFLLLFVPVLLLALEGYISEERIEPWFTGPIVTANPNAIPAGHYNIEPYLYGYAYTASYDENWDAEGSGTYWSVASETIFQMGVLSWLDIGFTPTFYWNHNEGAANWAFGDFSVQFDAQLHRDTLSHKSWWPSIKFTIKETAPTGKYRHLNPAKQGTQLGGFGSWVTTAALTFGKMIHFSGYHFLHSRLSVQGNYWAPTHLKGYNVYGGNAGTDGMYYPGWSALLDFGLEYSMTRNWALAFDFQGAWQGSSRFHGKDGEVLEGVVFSHTVAPTIQYSLAPALEYNWSENWGVIGGVWFTVTGKNSPKFTTGVIALNYFK
ncbi:MAG: hypothetical protein KGJ02_07255 [Verrucomicrobiota bacterium]|nr:hypothetical protein [Verrucomicrobiota bacterium]